MDGTPRKPHSTFKRFFFRGLGIVLPTVLTIWLLLVAYQFTSERIASPINTGVKAVVILASPWPQATDADYDEAASRLPAKLASRWEVVDDDLRRRLGESYSKAQAINFRRDWMKSDPMAERLARREALDRMWGSISIGSWQVLDLIGLVVAVVLIYIVGLLLGSFIGRRLHQRGEDLIDRVPLIRRVYPAVKQITDFFFGDQRDQLQFSRVVAVQYPRMGLWSVGLVTGATMRMIEERVGSPCLTVFVPSSPTPFTGYVITVPQAETIDLEITIEDALKFAVSGGVLVPPSQLIASAGRSSGSGADTMGPPPGA